MPLVPLLASVACLATPVHGDVVRAGPFTGYIVPQYDVVKGRFRLHVGAYRNPSTGLSQKIPWFVPLRYRVGGSLVITGRRLGTATRTFRQEFQRAGSSSTPDKYVFPSSLSPPSAGCWRLTLRSGSARGTLTVLIRG